MRNTFICALSEQKHQTKSRKQSIDRASARALGVIFKDHIITDNEQHSTARKGKRKRKHGTYNAYRKVPDKGTDDLHGTCNRSDNKRASGRCARKQHRGNNYHSLRQVLQRDTARNEQCVRNVTRAKANPRGDPRCPLI